MNNILWAHVIVMVKHGLCYAVDIGQYVLRSIPPPSPALLFQGCGLLKKHSPGSFETPVYLIVGGFWGVERSQSISPPLPPFSVSGSGCCVSSVVSAPLGPESPWWFSSYQVVAGSGLC